MLAVLVSSICSCEAVKGLDNVGNVGEVLTVPTRCHYLGTNLRSHVPEGFTRSPSAADLVVLEAEKRVVSGRIDEILDSFIERYGIKRPVLHRFACLIGESAYDTTDVLRNGSFDRR